MWNKEKGKILKRDHPINYPSFEFSWNNRYAHHIIIILLRMPIRGRKAGFFFRKCTAALTIDLINYSKDFNIISLSMKMNYAYRHVFIMCISYYFHCSCAPMSSQKRLRTSAVCAPVKKVLATKDPHSTVSFQISCAKEAILPTITVPVASLSMVPSSKMRTSLWSILDQELCPWWVQQQQPS